MGTNLEARSSSCVCVLTGCSGRTRMQPHCLHGAAELAAKSAAIGRTCNKLRRLHEVTCGVSSKHGTGRLVRNCRVPITGLCRNCATAAPSLPQHRSWAPPSPRKRGIAPPRAVSAVLLRTGSGNVPACFGMGKSLVRTKPERGRDPSQRGRGGHQPPSAGKRRSAHARNGQSSPKNTSRQSLKPLKSGALPAAHRHPESDAGMRRPSRAALGLLPASYRASPALDIRPLVSRLPTLRWTCSFDLSGDCQVSGDRYPHEILRGKSRAWNFRGPGRPELQLASKGVSALACKEHIGAPNRETETPEQSRA